MIARCTLIKHLFSKTGNVILHQEVLICFGFRLQFASLKNDTGRTKMYRTYTVHEDKVYQKSLHLWWITLHSRNKYINSNTLKLPPIHILKSLYLRRVYAVWNIKWKWQQIPPQTPLGNSASAAGEASCVTGQCFPPCRECYLIDWGAEQE